MTDDALHLNWVFEKSFMWEALCFEVIANNELAFSHLWSQGKKKRKKKDSSEIIYACDGHRIAGHF